jgi:hypothetical protein
LQIYSKIYCSTSSCNETAKKQSVGKKISMKNLCVALRILMFCFAVKLFTAERQRVRKENKYGKPLRWFAFS